VEDSDEDEDELDSPAEEAWVSVVLAVSVSTGVACSVVVV